MTTIPFATVKSLYAKKVNKDETTAAKQLRARLRANFDALATSDPTHYGAKGKVKERANDKRPWGDIPATFVRDVLNIDVAKPATRKRAKVTA